MGSEVPGGRGWEGGVVGGDGGVPKATLTVDFTTLCFCSTLTVCRKKTGGHTAFVSHCDRGSRTGKRHGTLVSHCVTVYREKAGALVSHCVTVYSEKIGDICFTLCGSVQGKYRGHLFHTVTV